MHMIKYMYMTYMFMYIHAYTYMCIIPCIWRRFPYIHPNSNRLDLKGRLDRKSLQFNPPSGFSFIVLPRYYQRGVEGFALKDSTFFLFEHEYALPIIPFNWAAYAATIAEHLFPVLLVLGLFTRLSATALLIMTLVIQFFVYPGAWALHLTWIAVLIPLVARGGGAFSLDRMFKIP